MNEKEESLLLTSTQVAELLVVSKRTLWRLIAAGKFPRPIKFNVKLARWKRSDIVKYIEELR